MTSSMNLLSFSTSALVRSEYSKSIRLSLVLQPTLAENRADVNGHSGRTLRPQGSRSGPGHRFLADRGFPLLNRRKQDSTGSIAVGQCDADALQADRLPE